MGYRDVGQPQRSAVGSVRQRVKRPMRVSLRALRHSAECRDVQKLMKPGRWDGVASGRREALAPHPPPDSTVLVQRYRVIAYFAADPVRAAVLGAI